MRRLHIAPADGLAIGGLLLLAIGLWWVYPPAAPIVVGLLLLVASVRLAR